MANYTIELRDVLKREPNIFGFAYPFYDEKKRPEFEKNFVRHFFFREIGAETIDRFLWNLEDKFATVFPYYNELFKAAEIEYSVLDNYKLTETTTIKRENSGKSGVVSSTVGKLLGEQRTEVEEGTTAEGNENINTTGKTERETETGTTENEKGGSIVNRNALESTETEGGQTSNRNSETNATHEGSTETAGNESVNKSAESEGAETREDKKRFLDTPQGAVDLSANDYLTNFNHDNTSAVKGEASKEVANSENSSSVNVNDDTVTTLNENNSAASIENRNSEAQEETNTETENERHSVGSSVESAYNAEEGERTTRESRTTASDTTHTEEQRTAQDNNTRTETAAAMSETLETVRSGNIGVDTDSDMIHKHINLQKILKKIELMFFDECEDLFMGVY